MSTENKEERSRRFDFQPNLWLRLMQEKLASACNFANFVPPAWLAADRSAARGGNSPRLAVRRRYFDREATCGVAPHGDKVGYAGQGLRRQSGGANFARVGPVSHGTLFRRVDRL